MKITSVTPILNVSDVPASVIWFERIGWGRSFSWNDGGMIKRADLHNEHGPAKFAGLFATTPSTKPDSTPETPPGSTPDSTPDKTTGKAPPPMLFLCKDGQGARDPRPCLDPASDKYGGVWLSWWVESVDTAHAACVAAGVEIVRPPKTEPWGVREFLIRHPDGHYFRISSHEA